MKNSVTYEVRTLGRVNATYLSEEEAIKNCGEESCVVMVVKDGSYSSQTTVCPEKGQTYSN